MAKKQIVVLLMMVCCTATSLFAEENKDVTYTQSADVLREQLQFSDKGQNQVRDFTYFEKVDSVYKVAFEGEELTYTPDEAVMVKKNGRLTFIQARSLQAGDTICLKDNQEGTLADVLVDDVYMDQIKSLHVKTVTKRSGPGMDVAIEGFAGTDQYGTKKLDGRVSLRFNYDLRDWRFTALVGMETSEYSNFSQNNNKRYLAPLIGAECIYKYHAVGDFEQHIFGAGAGFYASLYKSHYEDDFVVVNTRGYGINARAIPFVYILSPRGSKFQLSTYAFVEYRMADNLQGMRNHGVAGGIGITIGGLFSNKVK
jgi:hypothetical protein